MTVELVDASPDAMLALSMWYNARGFGTLSAMPAFGMDDVAAALDRASDRRDD